MNTSIYNSMNDFIPTGNVCMAGAGEAIPDAEVFNGRSVAFKVHAGVLKEIAEASPATGTPVAFCFVLPFSFI